MARRSAPAITPPDDAPATPVDRPRGGTATAARAVASAPQQLRVLEWLENPDGGFWAPGSVIAATQLRPESIAILMERQIVMVFLSPAQIANLPLDAQ